MFEKKHRDWKYFFIASLIITGVVVILLILRFCLDVTYVFYVLAIIALSMLLIAKILQHRLKKLKPASTQ